MQKPNHPRTAAQAHGITPRNNDRFYSDNHGLWCDECGNSGHSHWCEGAKIMLYSCWDAECPNHVHAIAFPMFKHSHVHDAEIYVCYTAAGEVEKTPELLALGDVVLLPTEKGTTEFFELF